MSTPDLPPRPTAAFTRKMAELSAQAEARAKEHNGAAARLRSASADARRATDVGKTKLAMPAPTLGDKNEETP